MNMKYLVEVRNTKTDEQVFYDKLTKNEAIKSATKEKQLNANKKNILIYVSFYDTKNKHNSGYLTPCGNDTALQISWNH